MYLHVFLPHRQLKSFLNEDREPCVLQYIPRNMHTVTALLCFVVVIHWLIFPYPSGLLHWHCGNLTIAPVPAKQPWWIWINTSCDFIMNDCITTTKQSTTKPCAYSLGYTVNQLLGEYFSCLYTDICIRCNFYECLYFTYSVNPLLMLVPGNADISFARHRTYISILWSSTTYIVYTIYWWTK